MRLTLGLAGVALLLTAPLAFADPLPVIGIEQGNGVYVDFDGVATFEFYPSAPCGDITVHVARHFLGQDLFDDTRATSACTEAGPATAQVITCLDIVCTVAGVEVGGATLFHGYAYDGVFSARTGTPA
ncbi:MAG: hypothetical protein LC624_11965 [Halobacteriales archaeon]|nr:hypothetical protein [Halobacteriales archaeon]